MGNQMLRYFLIWINKKDAPYQPLGPCGKPLCGGSSPLHRLIAGKSFLLPSRQISRHKTGKNEHDHEYGKKPFLRNEHRLGPKISSPAFPVYAPLIHIPLLCISLSCCQEPKNETRRKHGRVFFNSYITRPIQAIQRPTSWILTMFGWCRSFMVLISLWTWKM